MLTYRIATVLLAWLAVGAVFASQQGPGVELGAGEKVYAVAGSALRVEVIPLVLGLPVGYSPCTRSSPDGAIWFGCITHLSHVSSIMAVTRQASFSMVVVGEGSAVVDSLAVNDIEAGWYHMKFGWELDRPPAHYTIFVTAGGDTIGELRGQ